MQTPYIALLRGINVLGKNIIKMDSLKRTMEKLGFGGVRTYIQSGNILFLSEEKSLTDITAQITGQLHTDFGFTVPVIVLERDTLKSIVRDNPLAMDASLDPARLHVTFLATPPPHIDKATIEAKKLDGERIAFSDLAVYLYCPHGYGHTKLSNDFLEKKLGVIATTRNWKTTLELLDMASTPAKVPVTRKKVKAQRDD